MADRVGQQLGNYQLIRLLGEGGFAEVYLGEHIYLKTQAAIKILQMRLASEDREGFLKEARTIAGLKHPHIIRVLDFGIDAGTPFLVMDYAPHGTLRKRHPKGVPLPLPTIVNYVKQIAPALHYAHERKLVHRDVKPENLLLGEDNEVLLSDFGIALVTQSSRYQSTQEVVGTAAYMAPEQLQGKPRPASDQYSLGIVVYEWMCGDRPFHGTFTELYSQHLFVPPPSLSEKVPELSSTVEEIVFMALAKDPKERFGSVQAFATALERACQPAPSHQAALSIGVLPVSEPSSPSEAVATVLPTQLPQPTNVVTPPSQSLQPTDVATPSIPLSQPTVAATPTHAPALPPPPTEESIPSDRPWPSQLFWHRISRRAVVGSLVGLVIAGGGITWLALSQRSQVSSPSLHPTVTTPSMFGFDLQHTHFNPSEHILSPVNVSHLVLDWSTTIGDGGGSAWLSSSPVVANGIVYIGSWGNKLYAFDAKTGTTRWTYTIGTILSSPAVVDGVVYVGGPWTDIPAATAKVYALDAKAGTVLWTTPTGGAIDSSPAVANGVVYIGAWDKKLYAFDARTGAALWSTGTGGLSSSPAVANGVVYVGSGDSKLYALDAKTGTVLWTAPTGGTIGSSPAILNGMVYVGSGDSKLYALDAKTGTVLWATPTGNGIGSSPAVANGVVYVGSGDSKLYALDAKTGTVLWTAPTGGAIDSSPAVANGVVYIGSNDGKLYAFDAKTGTTLWTYTIGMDYGIGISSSPVVADGIVYVGSDGYKMYAFHLPDT